MSPLPSSAFFMTCHIGPLPALRAPRRRRGLSGLNVAFQGAPDGASRLLSGSVGRRTPAP